MLNSKGNEGVMAKMTGMIFLEEPGTYTFGFELNDGVRLEIGDYMVVEDPDVHADRYSDLGMIQANAAGWSAHDPLLRAQEHLDDQVLLAATGRRARQPAAGPGRGPGAPGEAAGLNGLGKRLE